MDSSSLLGLLLGIAAVAGGNFLEGGKLGTVFQATAALIVLGGTFGATLLSFPLRDIFSAISSLREVFSQKKVEAEPLITSIIEYSVIVRRDGLMALNRELPQIDNGFLRKALGLAIDGMGIKALRETMEQENNTYEMKKRRIARVYETAGGFSPTIGIIGAVLGLIHVMDNLSDPSLLGSGIAVAFVATIYGVGLANLILLPISKKLINKMNHELIVRDLLLEGVIGIESGINPYYLEEKLRAFLELENR